MKCNLLSLPLKQRVGKRAKLTSTLPASPCMRWCEGCEHLAFSDSDVPYSVPVSVLPKQFVGKGYTVWFSITFAAVVRTGIWNLAMVKVIARLLFTKSTMHCFTSN